MSLEPTVKPKRRVKPKAILREIDEHGNYKTREYFFKKNTITTIGRDENNHIVLNDEAITREKHCAIIIDENENVYIKDNSNSNFEATLVNDKDVNNKAKRLFDGDIIEIGNLIFKITIK